MSPQPPHSMKILIEEIRESVGNEEYHFETNHADGLGVHRSLTVMGDSLTLVKDALERVSRHDRRIKTIEDHDDYLLVWFPSDQIVWSRGRFGFGHIYDALAAQAVETPVEKPQPRKRAARKASTKSKDTTE